MGSRGRGSAFECSATIVIGDAELERDVVTAMARSCAPLAVVGESFVRCLDSLRSSPGAKAVAFALGSLPGMAYKPHVACVYGCLSECFPNVGSAVFLAGTSFRETSEQEAAGLAVAASAVEWFRKGNRRARVVVVVGPDRTCGTREFSKTTLSSDEWVLLNVVRQYAAGHDADSLEGTSNVDMGGDTRVLQLSGDGIRKRLAQAVALAAVPGHGFAEATLLVQ
jgi:hypothetical protein